MTAAARLRRHYKRAVRQMALHRQALCAAEEWVDRLYRALAILEGGKDGLRPEVCRSTALPSTPEGR